MSPERATSDESTPGRKAQARRSASLLKSRLLKEEQTAFDTALRSFAMNPAFERMSAMIARSRRRFVLGRGDAQEHAMLLGASLKASFSQVFLVAPPRARPPRPARRRADGRCAHRDLQPSLPARHRGDRPALCRRRRHADAADRQCRLAAERFRV